MRFKNYINENYKKALNIGEPEVGSKYSDDAVQRRITTIEAGIKDANKLPDDEHKEGILADLEDKLDKWQNVDQETEAPKAPAPDEDGEEEAGEEDAEAEEEEAGKEKEDKEKDREDKEIEKDEKAMDRDEEREKEREKKEKEREKQKEKLQKKESMNFKQYMHLNSDISK